ncbi:MAG: DUF3877 family protein [Lachnospiraceae bacterium]|nr:DUF3877 family protein [Lachnospiraceae bacterium]
MDYSKLENNIIDVLKEEQIKLGYRSETVRLYYPLSSLQHFLACDFDITKMKKTLQKFVETAEDSLGQIEISNAGERFCFAIPPKGVDYVHGNLDDNEFICEFIRTIERHGCTIEEIIQLFYRYSDTVCVKKTEHGEFDYLLYFENGKPDNFRYCISDEGCHMIYHRFTEEDYRDFNF